MFRYPPSGAGPDTVGVFGAHVGGRRAFQVGMTSWAVSTGPPFAAPWGEAPSVAIPGCPPLPLHPPAPSTALQLPGRGRRSSPPLCTCPPWRGTVPAGALSKGRHRQTRQREGWFSKVTLAVRYRCGLPPACGTPSLRGWLGCPEMPRGAHGAHVEVEEPALTGMRLRGAGGE